MTTDNRTEDQKVAAVRASMTMARLKRPGFSSYLS